MKAILCNRILTDEQKSLLDHFRSLPLVSRFYLTGGTALSAFYLEHRLSEDLDFFTSQAFEVEEILSFLKTVPDIEHIQYERRYDRRIFLLRYPREASLRVEFTTYPFDRLESALLLENLQVDSLRDILANKLMALTDRREAKDFIDLYVALKKNPQLDLEKLIGDTEKKFAVVGIQQVLQRCFVEAPPAFGLLKMSEQVNETAVADFFSAQAKHLIARSLEEES